MKFYNFDDAWPYTAVIYAKDEKDAIAKYIEEVTDTLDEEEQKLAPNEIQVADIMEWCKATYDNEGCKFIENRIQECLNSEFTQLLLLDHYLD